MLEVVIELLEQSYTLMPLIRKSTILFHIRGHEIVILNVPVLFILNMYWPALESLPSRRLLAQS